MKYLLDTNACITFLRGRNLLLAGRLLTQPAGDVVLCSIVAGELFHGAEKSRNPLKERPRVEGFVQGFNTLPYDLLAAREYGRVRHELEQRGLPIGESDMQIAAIAITRNLIVVTHNTSEFNRVPNLVVEDWELP